jgi:putative endonuclease
MPLFQSVRLSVTERLLASRPSQLPQHLQTGEQGELAALFYLRRQGFVIVARRWRTSKQRGDIDLIAWEADTLCFIEVKTRGSHDIASAESAVDEDKRKVLRRMARQYRKAVEPPAENVRFDLVSVYLENSDHEITLFRGAFDW